jgi:tetratricopeptide (TPR) repeat protein
MRRPFAIVVAAVVLLATAITALAQIQRIQGTVVDEEGKPVAGAGIEVTIVILADAVFAVRNNDQTIRAQTNANGDYIVTVPAAREYRVTAAKEGLGSDQINVVAARSGLVTANLTLWKSPPAPITAPCGVNAAVGAFARSPLSTGAPPGLSRLLGWLEAVHLHTPGCNDAPAIDVGRLALRDIEVLLRDVKVLVEFLRRVEEARMVYAARGRADRDQLIFFIYERRFTLDELQRQFFGNQALVANELLLRAAVMHADVAIFGPTEFGRHPLVEDGGRRGWRGGSSHWEVGRQLLESVTPSAHDAALLWYRAVSAHLFREGNLAELADHMARGRQVFPRSADLLFDSGAFHHELSSPAIQASLEQLRANGVRVDVGARVAELERAERFFRDALVVAPNHAGARLRLGHALGALGRHKEAAIELRQVIDAKPDGESAYLAALALGYQEEALGRRDEARRRYEQAAALYPDAQSPRMALSGLARRAGDRANAQLALQSLAALSDPVDPWWEFYQPHKEDADVLMNQMRQMGR